MKKKASPSTLFVELPDHSGVRRDVLMSTKDVLDALKRYEEYQRIKSEKMQALAELRRTVSQISTLNRKLKSKLPKTQIRVPEVSTREREELFTGPSPQLARPKSKLDSLQEELEKIESRLGALE
jgi:hypothetical protein